MKILVTGATGFVGRRLCTELILAGHQVRAFVHSTPSTPMPDCDTVTGDITDRAAVANAVGGVDVVIHLAARAHLMKDTSADPLSEYRRVNVEGTRLLLDVAAGAGVSFFAFASSVKSVGETSKTAWNSAVVPNPVDPYGVSKREAELLVAASSLRHTTLRFPLIYGPGVRGNVLRLFSLVNSGWPIPVGEPPNSRSILFVGNATAAILRVVSTSVHSGCATPAGPFFVADGPPVSTSEFVRDIALALGVPARTIRIPVGVARRAIDALTPSGADIRTRSHAIVTRLAASLEVDADEFFAAFHFTPPFSRRAGLAETASWFRHR